MTGKRIAKKTKPPVAIIHDQNQKGALKDLGGSNSDHWNNVLINQAASSLWTANSDEATLAIQRGATVAALAGIGPKDEIEAMMAAQLIAAHNAAMECYRRAMIGEQTFDGRRENLSQANKLSRTYAVLVEALNRHRGKGQQKVTVEHVHVYEGGQAIVGHVEGAGGGGRAKQEEQAHAKQISHAPRAPLWSENPQREALPVACDAQRTLPDARWPIDGSAER
jgi:hypothetical protein